MPVSALESCPFGGGLDYVNVGLRGLFLAVAPTSKGLPVLLKPRDL